MFRNRAKLLLGISCFLWSTVCMGQTFSLTLGSSTGIEGAQSVALYGSDILVGGTKNDSACIIRLSSTGIPVWAKTLALPSSVTMYVNSLDVTGDGYIVGTAFGINAGFCAGYYFKLDGSGNPVFVKNNEENYYFQRVLDKNATQYAVFGAKYLTGSSGTDMKIFTVSKTTGNIVSQSDKISFVTGSGFAHTDDVEGSIVLDENNMYTVGRFWHSGTATDAMRPHLARYNSAGKIKWAKYLHESYLGSVRIYPQNILYKSPNYFYVPYFSDETCTGVCTDYVPGLMKLDTSGNVLFDKTYDIPSSNGEVLRASVTDGLNHYLVGYTNFNGGNRDIFVIKVDANGNVLKAKRFGSPLYDEFFPTSFIRPAVCDGAHIYIASSTGSDIALMKIDTSLFMACDEAGVTCAVQNITPFSDELDYVLIPETASVVPGIMQPGSIPANQVCDSLNAVDSVYSTTPVVLNAAFAGADSYFWNTGFTTPTFTANVSGVYVCQVIDGCCSFTRTFVVCIPMSPEFTLDSITNCLGKTYNFYPVAASSNDFAWYVDGNFVSTASLLSTMLDSGSHTVSLTVSHPACGVLSWSSTQSLTVENTEAVGQELFVSNIFTPNGDGINDDFKVTIYPVDNYSIHVFNRWGQEIFSSTEIDKSWKGTFNNKKVSEDVYAYIIRYNDLCENGVEKKITGWVHVTR